MYRILYLLTLVYFIGIQEVHTFEATSYDSIHQRVEHALDMIEKQWYHSAIAQLEEVKVAYSNCDDCKSKDTDKRLYAQIHYLMGYSLFHVSNHQEALKALYTITLEDHIDRFYLVKAHIGIANVFNERKNSSEARRHLEMALKLNDDSLRDPKIELTIYNNIANSYAQKEQYDTALMYLNKSLDLMIMYNDSSHPSIYSNIANIYVVTERFDMAERYFHKALALCRNQGDKRYAETQILISLSTLYSRMGNETKALEQLEIAEQMAKAISARQLLSQTYNNFSSIYEKQKKYKTALYYARRASSLYDSIFSTQNAQSIERLIADFQTYQIEANQKILKRDLAISNDQLFRKNLNIGILSFLILITACFLFFSIRRLLTKNKELKELDHKLSDIQSSVDQEKAEIVERFQSTLELKHNELTTNALLLIKAEGIANELTDKLQEFRRRYHKDAKTMELVIEMEQDVKELYIGKGWDEFRHCFEQVNSSFYEKLDIQFPNLSPSDRRFAALLSLNLSTKEIAILTNRSIRGVETSKFRLKKKMTLGIDDNLTEILINLK